MNNEIAAVEQADHLATTEKPVATWARALRAMNTLDFRPLDAATNVPGIEQLAWFAAYSGANNRGVAWKSVGRAVEGKPDFCRIVGTLGYDVETGNVLLQIWLPLEIRETSDVYKLMHARGLPESGIWLLS